jgi:hypothetical protein
VIRIVLPNKSEAYELRFDPQEAMNWVLVGTSGQCSDVPRLLGIYLFFTIKEMLGRSVIL